MNSYSDKILLSSSMAGMAGNQGAVMLQYANTDIVYHFRHMKRPSELDQLQENWRKMGRYFFFYFFFYYYYFKIFFFIAKRKTWTACLV